jgi:hypothetical protein
VGQIDRNFATDPNDTINTEAFDAFEAQRSQIEKDIDRTMSDHPHFGKNGKGQDDLRQILRVIVLMNTGIGYVQGMNFLVVALLYHSSPEVTLFLITVLFEDY